MRISKLYAAVALLALSAGAALADPVEGQWKTQADDGAYAVVTVTPCGPAFCGVISRTFNDSGEYVSENKGKAIVWDMVAKGGGSYKDGKIWQPSTGKIYRSKMTLEGGLLKVSGCIGPICKTQTWLRVK
jgi:uncharacterized protein (DUF2147 family)